MSVSEPAAGPVSRRNFLRGAASTGSGAVLSFARELGAAAAPAPARSATVLGHHLVQIPAAPSFRFAASTGNEPGAGETAPIRSPYWSCRTPVTNAQYARFTRVAGGEAPGGGTGWQYPGDRADEPVRFVSSVEAKAYCAWLNRQQSRWRFRLPTEAEWEHAARGSEQLLEPDGTNTEVIDAQGSFARAGSPWEWTASAIVAQNGAERGQTVAAVRGGSGAQAAGRAATYRGEGRAIDRGYDGVGFRVVASRR